MTKEDILEVLDNSNDGFYCYFISLGDTYSYLIDTRLNIFRNENQWAIAIERLGYNPRAGYIILEIYYYGNCLINLEVYNNRYTNHYSIHPIELDNFSESIDGECLKPEAKFFIVRGKEVELSHNEKDYLDAGIVLEEYEPNTIRVEEVGRLLTSKYSSLFRATDEELHKSIPTHLQKILVLNEWYHKDFEIATMPKMTDEQLLKTYEFNKQLTGLAGMNFEAFSVATRRTEENVDNGNRDQWENNRPSLYETWQLIAKVIETGNINDYKPTLAPNTHWSNWQESGSL